MEVIVFDVRDFHSTVIIIDKLFNFGQFRRYYYDVSEICINGNYYLG